jgi:hypothetical protein
MTTAVLQSPRVFELGGAQFVEVPWEDARALQRHLRDFGIGSVLHLHPETHEACLAVLTDFGAERIEEALVAWQPDQ